MFIIRLLFYALEGFMGSSFLSTINIGLGLYSLILFVKLLIQFGLPNHPARFTLYLVSLCVSSFFVIKGLTGIGLVAPMLFIKWRTLPLVAGGLALLLQVITSAGQLSLIQQKVVSRLPLMAGLLVFAFFSDLAEYFFATCIIASALFLSISVGRVRYQKRIFFKMVLSLALFGLLILPNYYWSYVVGELFLFPAIFYFFIFQQTFGVSALVEEFQSESLGVAS
jgi:hypothetical protein